MKKVRWFIYTVVVGLMPFLLRGCIFLVMKQKDVDFLFDPIDFIILGLIINISIINDLERNISIEKEWKSIVIGFSILFLIMFTVFFAITIITTINKELFDLNTILIVSIIISIVSIIQGFVILDKIEKSEVENVK